ncbi:MAG: 3-hydroxyacyl-CoA dehydrogenase NAD-binding domain-containing protein [Pseudomonadota bacterium]
MTSIPLVRLECEGDVALIITNHPPVNTINAAVRAGLRAALARLAALQGIRAVVVLCEGSTFFSGADIGEFAGPPREVEYREIFNSLEQLPMPVVAAMHGTVMGGGLEIALACHYRIASPGSRFGLPEVTLGIIPGAGGTQRLPRLIGIAKALDFILSARPIDAVQAVSLGLLDTVVTGELRCAAIGYARNLASSGQGPRRTGDLRVDPLSATAAVLDNARAQAKKIYPHREAPLVAIDVVSAAARMPLAEGLEYETTRVNECKRLPESLGAVHAFFAERETRRIPGLAADARAKAIAAAGVVGAGTMGGGIAIAFANAGIPVTLLDQSADALQRGLKHVEATYQSMVNRGRITDPEKAARLALIRGSLSYDDLRDADIVIEAVFEDLALKRQIFSALDAVAKPGAILATNTSTLDVASISLATRRPQDVIGTHFFSPANVMPLLEVIRTDATSDSTIRSVIELAKPLRKTPVLSRVCYGFIGNRMMEGYAREAERIVLEGATPREVDSALEEFGMAMGILAVFDMAGIDVGVNVHAANAARYPPDPTYYQADAALHAAGRLGQKNGKGYYRYEQGNRTRLDDPEALDILAARAAQLGVEQRRHSREEIVERCIFPLLNEGIRILEEGIALRASDIDVVWTAGYGFPRHRGGPLFYADQLGLTVLLDGILKFQRIFGPMHWQPAALLLELARSGQSIAAWDAARRHRNPT